MQFLQVPSPHVDVPVLSCVFVVSFLCLLLPLFHSFSWRSQFEINRSAHTFVGFTTFFDAQACPTGWSTINPAQGRLLVSVTDPGQAGVTVGVPLRDAEDRTHTHRYESYVAC